MADVSATANVAGVPWTISGNYNKNFGVSATAGIPSPAKTSTSNSVKIATPDLLIFGEQAVAIEIMTDLIFEDIGGFELATISRHDLVNGQKVSYSPIKNLTSTLTPALAKFLALSHTRSEMLCLGIVFLMVS